MNRGFVLDTGALVGLEGPAKARRLLALLELAGQDERIVTSAGCVAQAWRGSARQATLTRLLRRHYTYVEDITLPVAKAIGAYLGRAGAADIVDAHVVMLAAEHGLAVISSDPTDLRALSPKLHVIAI